MKSSAVPSWRASWAWNMPPGFCRTLSWVRSADLLSRCIFDCWCSRTTSSRSRWHPEIQALPLKPHWVERFACFWQKERAMASASKCHHERPFFHESWNSVFRGFFADSQETTEAFLFSDWKEDVTDGSIEKEPHGFQYSKWLHVYRLLGFGWQRACGLVCGLRPILHV